jgi:hypothetical protein
MCCVILMAGESARKLRGRGKAGPAFDADRLMKTKRVVALVAPQPRFRRLGIVRNSQPLRHFYGTRGRSLAKLAEGVGFQPTVPHLRQIYPSGKISLFPKGKSLLRIPHPVPEEGALAIVTERWDRSCGGRNGIVRGKGLQGGINSVSDHRTC